METLTRYQSLGFPFGFKLIQSFSKKTKTNWEIGKKPILKNLKVLTVTVKVKYSDPESEDTAYVTVDSGGLSDKTYQSIAAS